MKKYIAYYRVSTKQQGLGLDAQKSIVTNYVQLHDGVIIEEYFEKESGKETINRPELQNALLAHREKDAILIVAKVDRLSRDVADVFHLVKSKQNRIEVVDVDASDTMMLGIFSTLAMKERELISSRTRDALQALKEQGTKLGSPIASETIRTYQHLGVEQVRTNANNNENNKKSFAAIRFMEGTLTAKADYLNENGFQTPRGCKWSATQVRRLIARYEKIPN